jgi:hypothetical protein
VEIPDESAGAPAGVPAFLAGTVANTPGSAARVQRKLVVGAPDDPYEREAETVADTARTNAQALVAPSSQRSPAIQRKCTECAAEEEEEEKNKPPREGVIQRRCKECEEEEAAAEEDEEQYNGHVQRAAASAQTPQSVTSSSLPTSGSQPLSPLVRQQVEPVLGVSLSAVRVHDDAAAHRAAAQLGAKAFTHKQDIWLGAGQRTDDVSLLAHEATHVAQQSGGDAPEIQRAPIEHRHEEDGSAVRARMKKRIERKILIQQMLGFDPDDASEESVREVRAQESGEAAPEAKPDVDRPALERPGVEKSADTTKQEAEAPAKPLADGEGKKKGEKDGKRKEEDASEADTAAALAEQAFAASAGVEVPVPELPVKPPPITEPVDSGGVALTPNSVSDAETLDLASQAQTLRDEGLRLRQLAAEERRNAGVLRGNLQLVRSGIASADTGIKKSEDHLAFRRDVGVKARQGLTLSEEKAARVAAEAPGYAEKSDEGKEESEPMAAEAKEQVAQNAANTPEDEEAAEKAQEQGGNMSRASDDIGTTDDAITKTKEKALTLQEDAAHAKKTNLETGDRLAGAEETLAQTGDRLGTMAKQNARARAEAESLASAPEQVELEAQRLDDEGKALIAMSFEIEADLARTQKSFEAGMHSIPAAKRPEAGETGGGEPEEGIVQRAPDESAATDPAGAGTATAELPEPDATPTEDATPTDDQATDEQEGAPGEEAPTREAPMGYEAREKVDLAAGVPAWLSGAEAPDAKARAEAEATETERRANQLAMIRARAQGAGGFERLSAADKAGIALGLMKDNLFGKVGGIKWPGWGTLALGLIDPRSSLMGVVGGLSMMLSGAANLFSLDQWKKDPLGNLLKSAADIATGLTIILGSITALAGVIIAIMVAITILSLGFASPVTGPIIAFCTSVLVTVGGWTIAVGKVALILQALVFIKNLIDAMTAETAEELHSEADQMTEDVSNAGNVVMQIGMAKLGQVGGRAAQAEIRAAGGGVRYAARMGGQARAIVSSPLAAARTGVKAVGGGVKSAWSAGGQALKAAPKALGRGVRAVGRGVKALPRAIGRGVKGLPGRVASAVRGTPSALRAAVRTARRRIITLPRRLGREFSKDLLVGKNIKGLRGAAAASKTARAEAFAETNALLGKATSSERAALASAASKEGKALSRSELDAELSVAQRGTRRASTEAGYIDEVELPNGHVWRRTKDGRWCRFSNKPSICAVVPEGATPPTPLRKAKEERLDAIADRMEREGIPFDRDAARSFIRRSRNQDVALDAIEDQALRRLKAERGPGTSSVFEGDETRATPNLDLRTARELSPSAALGSDLERAGFAAPGPGHHAHHVTPFKQAAEEMDWLHTQMSVEGIDQNTAFVGEWLPGTQKTPNVSGATPHLTIVHGGKGVKRDLAYTLTVRLHGKTGPEFLDAYGEIMQELATGQFKHVTAPSPRRWNIGDPPLE